MNSKTRKILCVLLIAALLAVIAAGCGKTVNLGNNAPITSKWEIKEFTVNGTTTKMEDTPTWLKIISASRNPKFSCKDGTNCTLSVNKKTRTGTVTMEDGHYVITFKNATTKFYGTISGNTLFLHDEGGKVLLVFEAK